MEHPPDNITSTTANNTNTNNSFYHWQSSNQKYSTNSVLDSWETVHAKLQYEKHLQDLQQFQQQQLPTSTSSTTNNNNNNIVYYDSTIPEPYPQSPSPLTNDNTINTNGNNNNNNNSYQREDMNSMNIIQDDPPTTEFGDLQLHHPPFPPTNNTNITNELSSTALLQGSSTASQSLLARPVRPAIKSSSYHSNNNTPINSNNNLMTNYQSSPNKSSMKRPLEKPSKSVYIRTLSGDHPAASISGTTTSTAGQVPSYTISINGMASSSSTTTNPSIINPSSILNTNLSITNQQPYFRFSNPDGTMSTNTSIFAGINPSIGSGGSLADEDDDNDNSNTSSKLSSTMTSSSPSFSTMQYYNNSSNNINPLTTSTTGTPTPSSLMAPPLTEEKSSNFRNQRAGHYNEYKVLQALRASKMAQDEEEEEDEDDEDDDYDDKTPINHVNNSHFRKAGLSSPKPSHHYQKHHSNHQQQQQQQQERGDEDADSMIVDST
jgi:hypothetical protein